MAQDLKLSPKMHEELILAANFYGNSAGSVSYCPRRTEDALIRRGLITYDVTVNNCPVITVKGWEYLASQGFERRSEDPGRLTLDGALAEAFSEAQENAEGIGACCEHAPMYHGARGCDECGCSTPRDQVNTYDKENDMADEVKDRTGPLSELQHKMMLSLLTGASHVEAGRANGKGPTHTSNIVSAAVAKMGCRRTGQALGYYATHLAYLEAASVLEAAKIRDPLGDVEDHVNHVLDGLASILRARAAALLPQ